MAGTEHAVRTSAEPVRSDYSNYLTICSCALVCSSREDGRGMNRFLTDVKSWAVEMIRQAEPPDKTKLLDPARTHTEILLALSDEEPHRWVTYVT